MDHTDSPIDRAIAKFPAQFGLRGHEGTFRISRDASYMTDARRWDRETKAYVNITPVPMLYTQRLWDDGTWHDFAKGTLEELQREWRALGR